jgi:hypothetical protein
LPLSFVIFSLLFLLLSRERIGQINSSELVFSFTMFYLSILGLSLLGPSFGGWPFFLIPVSCHMWRVSRVNPDWLKFFFLDFLWFFFSISSFRIKLFALELCYFFSFLTVWLFQERVGKVNPNWLRVFLIFFIGLWIFFIRSFFWIFFILISYRRLLIHQVTLSWLVFFLRRYIFWSFFFYLCF